MHIYCTWCFVNPIAITCLIRSSDCFFSSLQNKNVLLVSENAQQRIQKGLFQKNESNNKILPCTSMYTSYFLYSPKLVNTTVPRACDTCNTWGWYYLCAISITQVFGDMHGVPRWWLENVHKLRSSPKETSHFAQALMAVHKGLHGL